MPPCLVGWLQTSLRVCVSNTIASYGNRLSSGALQCPGLDFWKATRAWSGNFLLYVLGNWSQRACWNNRRSLKQPVAGWFDAVLWIYADLHRVLWQLLAGKCKLHFCQTSQDFAKAGTNWPVVFACGFWKVILLASFLERWLCLALTLCSASSWI